jgi:hypothetical protein
MGRRDSVFKCAESKNLTAIVASLISPSFLTDRVPAAAEPQY